MQKKKAKSEKSWPRVKEGPVEYKRWKHPGGKLLAEGSEALTDAELLAILISTGVKAKSAERIAEEIIEQFGSFKGLANQPLEKLDAMRGLGKVKTIRIAAAFEIARRIVDEVLGKHEEGRR